MVLEKIAERHNEWVIIAKACGCPDRYAEDVVQEVYIKLQKHLEKHGDRGRDKIIFPDGEVNTYYMFSAVKNMVSDLSKGENHYICWDEFYNDHVDEMDVDMELAFNKLIRDIRNEAASWGKDRGYLYHGYLFSLYFLTDDSMRDISKNTDISLTHIFQNITKYKKIIREKFSDRWEEFKKGNYEYD